MSDAKNDRLRQVFAFLDEHCASDPDLRQRLRAMLAASDPEHPPRASQEAATSAGIALHGPGASAAILEGPGASIGPYKLLQQIGEGGFGVVFMAQQERPVRRRVALKIIKLGMDTRQVVARFEQERQALALMDHPNIAKVLDAGSTDAGRPYFVMELCNGEPIVQYCDRNNLTIEERLGLLTQVCNAVQHAHGKGIIHRDLKPSNILIGMQDGQPLAKVIDFGIAKATSQKLTDKTLFTEHQQVIGTFQYMSPEQAEGSLDIDTRTDVYSLGVLLYELLTGSTPFDAKTLQNAVYGGIQRVIREVEPHKPSTRISESREQLNSLAAHRRIDPRRLGTTVRGELDWIVMKALEKNRSRRYETANGLAMDLQRYLTGEPVLAAPASAAYRLRKMVRRNKGAVLAAGGIAAALLAGVIGFAWQARIAQAERDEAVTARLAEADARAKADRFAAAETEQRRRAEDNEKKAEAINQFLVTMLGSANLRELGRDAKVSQVIDEASATVGTSFGDQPEVEATLRRILGTTYLSLGMLDAAEPHLHRALELDRELHGERSLDFVRSLDKMATWKGLKGDASGAVAAFERAIDVATEVCGPDAARTLGLQVQHANCLVDLGMHTEAEARLREALGKSRASSGGEATATQIAINSLAVVLHRLGRLEEAEQLYREAAELGENLFGSEHPDTLTARVNLASMLRSRGDLAAAQALMAATYETVKKVFGEAHPRTGGVADLLAQILADQGRFKDAAPLYEESLAIRLRAEGAGTIGTALVKQNFARTLMQLGENERAIALLRDCIEVRTQLVGAEDRETLFARLDLTNTLVRNGDHVEAEAMFVDLLEICPRALGEDDPATIIATNSFAVLLMSQERYADAEPWLDKALEVGRRVQGDDHPNTIITQLNRIAALREIDRLDEAVQLGPDAIQRFARVFGASHPNTAVAHSSHAQTLIELGRNDEARQHLLEAIGICKASTGIEKPTFARAALLLGRLYIDTDLLDEAEPVLREVEAVYARAHGDDDRSVAVARIELGRCRWSRNRFAEAEALLVDNVAVLERQLPAGLRDLRRALDYLAAFYAAWNAAEPDAARATKAAEWQAKAEARR